MVTDPVADFLTQLRNAARANKSEVIAPYSNLKNDIAKIFKQEGYLQEVEVLKKGNKADLKITLKTSSRRGPITQIIRISKPGRRRYVGSQEIPKVLGGLGVAVVSTSRGIMSGHEARKQKVGGELLCYIA
ncbi:MAG: 30S ribosomal protein S8 [Verrucomicrobiae bacterium]|nr:30S ribosomal protein S8 [Verrucomicrobiae bacterium]